MKKLLPAVLLPILLAALMSFPAQAVSTVVRVAFDPNMPPYQFSRDGEPVGVHIDLLDLIAERDDLILSYYPMENITACLNALEAGQVDVVLGTIHGMRALEGAGMETERISQASVCMVVPSKKVDEVLNGNGVCVIYQEGTIAFSYIRSIRNMHAIPVSNQVRAFELLRSAGEADAMVGIKTSVLYLLEQSGEQDNFAITSDYLLPVEFTMLVHSSNHELLDRLNSSLYSIRVGGDYERIHSQWVEVDNQERIQRIVRQVGVGALVVATGVMGIVLFNMRINRMLRQQVDEKTKELQLSNQELAQQVIETKKSHELRNYVVENNPSGIFVFDTRFRLTLHNPSAAALVLPHRLREGDNVFDIPLVRQLLRDVKDRIFLPGAAIPRTEQKVSLEQGGEAIFRYMVYLLGEHGAADQPAQGAILTVVDITKETQLKEQLAEQQKNEALNRIIASIAHEIRNPLMSIKTYTELIPRKRGNEAFQNEMARYIPQEVERVDALITDLIDYAKPKEIHREWVPVSELIGSCRALVEPMLRKKNIGLELDSPRDFAIWADKSRFRQIMLNILLNAVEAIEVRRSDEPELAGLIRIRTWEHDRQQFVQVSDNGIGMNEYELSRVTEPFFTTKRTGTGLGLSLSRQFLEDNGGRLYVTGKKFRGAKITMQFVKG